MKIPKGLQVLENSGKICKQQKTLYGLKQSSRAWYQRFDTHLLSVGFERNITDSNVYLRERHEGLCYFSIVHG